MSAGLFVTAGTVTTNSTFCTLQVGLPISGKLPTLTSQQTGQMITSVSYYILAGSGVSAGTVTFYELGADGVWRALLTPTPLAFSAPGAMNGTITGPFHGVQMQLTGLTGGNLTYAELKGQQTSSY